MSEDKSEITVGVQLSLNEIETILNVLRSIPGALLRKNNKNLIEKLIEKLAASKGALQRVTR